MRLRKGITLRFMLIVLVIASVLLTGIAACYSGIKANRQSLATSYLESNSQYAKKLALDTNAVMAVMQKNMDFIARAAGGRTIGQKELQNFFDRNQQYFNSLFYVDSDLIVQAMTPINPAIVGTELTSTPSLDANKARVPMISVPYVATTGRLIILVSSPIFEDEGGYAGFVGGTIYLEEDNVLSRLLSEHFYGNGSYLYVVDQGRHLIFHPDKKRLNEAVSDNPIIEKALKGQSGSQEVANSKGERFFAGYAYEPVTGWGIVSQTPVSVLQGPQRQLMNDIVIQALPILVVILLTVWVVAHRISKPLYQLAKFSEEAILDNPTGPPEIPVVHSRIYEVRQLYQKFHHHLDQLNTEIQKDGLTGLANRRTFDRAIRQWLDDGIDCSLILMDIDHFKIVNDTYGHLVGDEVLKYLASTMQTISREQDLCFRYGGEEFGILVRKASIKTAAGMAERLRGRLEASDSPTGHPITVSIGICSHDGGEAQPSDIIAKADSALYESKAKGRNKITIR